LTRPVPYPQTQMDIMAASLLQEHCLKIFACMESHEMFTSSPDSTGIYIDSGHLKGMADAMKKSHVTSDACMSARSVAVMCDTTLKHCMTSQS